MDTESAELEPIAQLPQIDIHNVMFFLEDRLDTLDGSFGLIPFNDIAFRVLEDPDNVVITQSNPTSQYLDLVDGLGVADTEYLVPGGSATGSESTSYIQHDIGDSASLLAYDTLDLAEQSFHDPDFLQEYSRGNATPTTFPSFRNRSYELSAAHYRYGQAEYTSSPWKEWEDDPISSTYRSENTNVFLLFEAVGPCIRSEEQQIWPLSSSCLTETMNYPNLNISTLENSGNDLAQRLCMESNMRVFRRESSTNSSRRCQ